VKLLLEYGANVHAKNDDALRWAVRRDHVGVVKVLLDHSILHDRYSADTIEALLTTTDNAMIQQLLRDYNTGEMLTEPA
jgi:ankyrin repeat protein